MLSTTRVRQSSLFLIILMALAMGIPAFAQDGGGRQRGQDRQRWEDMTDEQREEFQERMRERMAEREAEQAQQLRERLEMSEEDFEVIGPMIAKVQQLQRERDAATRGAGRGAPGQRGGGGGFTVEMTEHGQALSEATTALREGLEEDESADEIQKRLTALRQARAAMETAILDAQKELQSVLTARWEAELVVMGVLS